MTGVNPAYLLYFILYIFVNSEIQKDGVMELRFAWIVRAMR